MSRKTLLIFTIAVIIISIFLVGAVIFVVQPKIKDGTISCLKKYPVKISTGCIFKGGVDGWSGIVLYPDNIDTSGVEHRIDAFAPEIIEKAAVARYIVSPMTSCLPSWLININREWKVVGQIEFCNYIVNYNSSCNNCLLDWEEGCC